jgi:Cu/Ag efflux protein CusF
MEITEAPPQPNSSKAAWIVAGVATAVALIAAMIAVSAVMRSDKNNNTNANNLGAFAGFNRPVAGKIQSINGSSFKVQGMQVDTTSKTTFHQVVRGSLSDLKVGDTIVATGTTADNVFTATQINENAGQRNFIRNADGNRGNFDNGAPPQGGPQGGPGGGRFFGGTNGDARIGQITKIDGVTITLSGFNGAEQTINTTESTTYRVSKTATLKSLKVGDSVRVIGTTNGNKVTATEVTKGVNNGALAS